METTQNIFDLYLARVRRLAEQRRISPLDTFTQCMDAMNGFYQSQMENSVNLDALERDLHDFKQNMAELFEITLELDRDRKALYRFLEKKGLTAEYERLKYKRQMNAVYRRAAKMSLSEKQTIDQS